MRTLGTLVVAFLISLWITPLIRRQARIWRVLDRPSRRKVHRKPVARLGGVAVCCAWLVAMFLGLAFPGGYRMTSEITVVAGLGVVAMLLGAWDDWRDLPGKLKLAGQVAIASSLFALGPRIDRLTNPFGGELLMPMPLGYILTVLWIVGMMNAINLIDGLDGLACGIVACACFGLMAGGLYVGSYTAVVVLAALAGACLGFLRYNFFPAKIFLGDSGSQFIGFALGAAALINVQYKVATAAALLVPLAALALPIYDTALAIVRRVHGHRSIFRADKYHIHHRLLKMGLSQRQAVLFLYLVTLYFSCLAFLFVLIPERYALILLILLSLGVVIGAQTLRFIEFTMRRRIRSKARRRVSSAS